MKRLLLSALLLLSACAEPPGPQAPALPPLPPLALQPFAATLNALEKTLPQPTDAERRELAELADIALQKVEADARTAARAERALLEHPHCGALLEPALADPSPAVRRRAAWLCGQSGRSILQLPLVLRLKYENDAETVPWVADALQRLGNDAGLPGLDAAIHVPATAETAGSMAIAICRERGTPLSETPTWAELQQALRAFAAQWRTTGLGGRPGVAAPAPAELEARFAAHLATTQFTPLRPIDEARFVLVRCGRLPLPLLTRALSASEHYLRTMAMQVLAELGPCAKDVGPALLPLLGDPLTGSFAARALGEIGIAEAVVHLRARLAVPDTETRAEAAKALGLLRDAGSAPALGKLLDDGNEPLDVRVGAAFALLCLGPHAGAGAFLAEREAKQDYHESTLRQLRERLAAK